MKCFNERDGEIKKKLQEWFSKATRVVIAGIGNPLRRDDMVGVLIVRNLQNHVSSSVYLIECETVPENFIEPIIKFKPSHMLVIDAAWLNLEPGASKLLSYEQLMEQHVVSTHALPLRIFCEYIAKTTGAKIALLAIQPKEASFGEGLTPQLRKTAENLTDLLKKILHKSYQKETDS